MSPPAGCGHANALPLGRHVPTRDIPSHLAHDVTRPDRDQIGPVRLRAARAAQCRWSPRPSLCGRMTIREYRNPYGPGIEPFRHCDARGRYPPIVRRPRPGSVLAQLIDRFPGTPRSSIVQEMDASRRIEAQRKRRCLNQMYGLDRAALGGEIGPRREHCGIRIYPECRL